MPILTGFKALFFILVLFFTTFNFLHSFPIWLEMIVTFWIAISQRKEFDVQMTADHPN